MEKYNMNGEQFHSIDEPLSLSEKEIRIEIAPGQTREGSFTITGAPGAVVEGKVTSSRLCMSVVSERFTGTQDVVLYRLDASAFEVGDQIEGYFRILSNQGEYRLPYTIVIIPPEISSSLGACKNLYHFTNLAKSSWAEAVRVFYNRDFIRIFSDTDKKQETLYRGLSSQRGNEQNVEEFLIASGQKQAVEFLPDLREIRLEIPADAEGLVSQRVVITRNGWGYTRLEIGTEGDFISAEQSVLTEESFTGNRCEVELEVNPALLHAGYNFGRVSLYAPFGTIHIPVSVHLSDPEALGSKREREREQLVARLMRLYVDFRGRKISGGEWMSRTEEVIDQMMALDRSDPIAQLYRIQLLLTQKKSDEAVYRLARLNEQYRAGGEEHQEDPFPLTQYEMESDTAYCYRLYLTSLCVTEKEENGRAGEIAGEAARAVEEKLRRDPSNWRIAWLLMYLSDEYQKKPSMRWKMLSEEFRLGSRSPILYIEAYSMVLLNPAILYELGPFELSILGYAAKEGILSSGVMSQINYLAQRSKLFSVQLFRILVKGYEDDQLAHLRNETLSCICSLLIKGNVSDKKYFGWFQRGVEAQLQITRLYEYYMLSMPEDYDGEIPQIVLMYFAYQSTLPYERNAYLYRYLMKNQNLYAQLYQQYEDSIRAFTQDQLLRGHMNQDLKVLYDQYLSSGAVLSQDLAQAAVPVVFMCVIRTSRTAVRKVVLVYDKLRGEQTFPIENGICYLPIYGEENQIFFEDRNGSRYAASIAYTCDRMMDYEKYAKQLAFYETDHFGFDLYLSGMTGSYYDITDRNVRHFERLLTSGDLLPAYRRQIRSKLLTYYNANDCIREMDRYLSDVEPDGLAAVERNEILQYMVLRGLSDKALGWIRMYGVHGVDTKTLMNLCSRYLSTSEVSEDPALSAIVHETFRLGKYDENLLEYMNEYFEGLTEELEEVRQADLSYGVDTYDISRRMIRQMLYTGAQLPNQCELLEAFAAQDPPEALIAAALAQRCHYYLTADEEMTQPLFDCITALGRGGTPLLDSCRIAWLKDRSEKVSEISGKELEITTLFLTDLMGQSIIFPFFRQFIGILPDLQAYADETLVEYRGHRSDTAGHGHVVYHFSEDGSGRRADYRTRDMKEMYSGIYVTGFLLFFGEQLHYYITDDVNEKNIVESGTLGQDARIPEESDDRFGMINRIAMLAALDRETEALESLDKYDYTAHLVRKLFRDQQEQE
ncbi:MAG: hypothetical protein IJV26_08505 [Lachnospiraceae bacterium]|nr:hypothetical protein [Lachnospiraceae bacterium]